MIQKIQNPALEHYSYIDNCDTDKAVHSMLKVKISALNRGLIIPDVLISEVEDFMNRNIIDKEYCVCCPQCLKAHVLKKANDLQMTNHEINYLIQYFPGNAGHNGYYMDEERVVKLNYLI